MTGRSDLTSAARKAALAIARDHGGVHVGQQFGHQWQKSRFLTPYLRNTLWEIGVGVDTLETAIPWRNVDATMAAIETALHSALEPFDERPHVFTHLSHTYPTGCSVYTTYLFRLATDPAETLARWTAMKRAASEAIVTNGGTISHQHGVGKDHRPFLAAEKGPLGLSTIAAVTRHLDPEGLLNPGTLLNTGQHRGSGATI